MRPLTKGRSSLLTARSISASGIEFGGWNAQDVQVSVPVCLSPREGNGNPMQDSCLENPMDRGTWRFTVHGVAKSRTQLSDLARTNDWTFAYFRKLSL